MRLFSGASSAQWTGKTVATPQSSRRHRCAGPRVADAPRRHLVQEQRWGGSPAIGPAVASEIIHRAQAIASAAGIATDVEVEPAAPPAEVVLDWASGYDLLALGAPAASWLGGMLLAGVTDSALGRLETPVLTARAHGTGHCAARLLIASDGSADSAAPLALGGEIARLHESHVTLLHAVSHQPRVSPPRLIGQAEELRALGVGDADVQIREGHAHDVILDATERLNTSLVVMGSRRRTGARMLGSVSRRIVHEASCSVLTVPPEYAKESRQWATSD